MVSESEEVDEEQNPEDGEVDLETSAQIILSAACDLLAALGKVGLHSRVDLGYSVSHLHHAPARCWDQLLWPLAGR